MTISAQGERVHFYDDSHKGIRFLHRFVLLTAGHCAGRATLLRRQ